MNNKQSLISGFKPSPIGSIPNDWDVMELGVLISLISGSHLNPEDYNKTKNGTPYFTGPTDYSNNQNEITKWTIKKTATAINGDILLTVKGSGVGSLHKLQIEKISIGRQIMALRTHKGCSNSFIYYSLNQNAFRFQELAKGNMIPGLTRADILTTKIKLPPLPEQTAIAACLSTWDKAISATTALIAQKELRKKWLMLQLLTGKKRLPGFAKTKWHLKSLEEVAEFKNGKAHENVIVEEGKFIVVNSKFISTGGNVVKSSNENLCPLSINDIVMVMSDIPKGKALAKCFYINENEKYTLNQRICSIRAFENTDCRFLFYLLNRNIYYLSFDNGVGQTNLKKEEVLECPLLIPEKKEQSAIAQVLQAADKEINLFKSKLYKLKEQKKGLMQVLLTGRKRLII